jgi:hypothetical protein
MPVARKIGLTFLVSFLTLALDVALFIVPPKGTNSNRPESNHRQVSAAYRKRVKAGSRWVGLGSGKAVLLVTKSHRDEVSMEIDANPIREVLDDLFTLLEALETQNIAVLQFLKDQGIAPDDKLAPYLDRAGNASSVKWRAARARMNHLLAPAPKKASEPTAEKQSKDHQPETKNHKAKQDGEEQAKPKQAAAKETEAQDGKSNDAGNGQPIGAKTKDAAPKDVATPPDPERKDERPKTEDQKADNNASQASRMILEQDAKPTTDNPVDKQKGPAE